MNHSIESLLQNYFEYSKNRFDTKKIPLESVSLTCMRDMDGGLKFALESKFHNPEEMSYTFLEFGVCSSLEDLLKKASEKISKDVKHEQRASYI